MHRSVKNEPNKILQQPPGPRAENVTLRVTQQKKRSPFWRWLLYVFAGFVALIVALIIYVVSVSDVKAPQLAAEASLQVQRKEPSKGFYTLGENWFRKSNSGLYELYVAGDPAELGVFNGRLTKELVMRQEDHFSEQISNMIPSESYRKFLKYFIGWFNRDLDKHVASEYKQEIAGVSQAASPRYQYLGTNYQRILNYHAAHDIGHALQNLALVGCTSFGTWGAGSEDSSMIIGRNFDFYVGEKFAEDKIVAFMAPTKGYKFMTVTWGGFIGAVSGMNEKGLAVTINAAKTSMPSGSATPVSLVTREILQYASNINEAIAIAKSRKMFVSESFLVASAFDRKSVVIEKTPEALDVYDPGTDQIVCTNHFQSKALTSTTENKEQIEASASAYRYQRLQELLAANGKNSVAKTIGILRDRGGLHNADIGLGNEKAINQLIAHHSIVFEPEKLLVWVSTAPWQLGQYVAYDLKKVFAMKGMQQSHEIAVDSLGIAADEFLKTPAFSGFQQFLSFKKRIAAGETINLDSLVISNPSFYHTYVLAGDYLYKKEAYEQAAKYYKIALTKEIATKKEAAHIREQLDACLKKDN